VGNRKELLESTRGQLKSIDALLLEVSNTSLAMRVDKLMDSAARAFRCPDEDCQCLDEDPDSMSFTPIFNLYSYGMDASRTRDRNEDALCYMDECGLDVRVRTGYSSHSPNEDVPLGEPLFDFEFDALSGTVSLGEALSYVGTCP
jgi:hypothetical protein